MSVREGGLNQGATPVRVRIVSHTNPTCEQRHLISGVTIDLWMQLSAALSFAFASAYSLIRRAKPHPSTIAETVMRQCVAARRRNERGICAS